MREHLTFLLNLNSRLWFVWSHYLQVIKQPDYSSTSSLASKFFLIPLLVLKVSLSIGCRCVSSISPLYSHRKVWCYTVEFKLLLCFCLFYLIFTTEFENIRKMKYGSSNNGNAAMSSDLQTSCLQLPQGDEKLNKSFVNDNVKQLYFVWCQNMEFDISFSFFVTILVVLQ